MAVLAVLVLLAFPVAVVFLVLPATMVIQGPQDPVVLLARMALQVLQVTVVLLETLESLDQKVMLANQERRGHLVLRVLQDLQVHLELQG